MDARRFMVGLQIMHTKKPPGGTPGGLSGVPRQAPLHQAFGRVVVVVLQAVLVTYHLAVELVDQFVNRGVQVGM